MPKSPRFELRLPQDQMVLMKRAAKARGFRSANAYIQTVLGRDLRGSPDGDFDRNAYVAASIDRLAKEIHALHTTQQALFALTDSLTRLLLTCIPEPPPQALEQAKRRAKLRYDRFLVSVAQNMTSDTRATLAELTDRG
jgi:hypothetical protein